MKKTTTDNRPAIVKKVSERVTVVGFIGNLHDFDFEDKSDYGYSFYINTPERRYDFALFGDAKGLVEGEILIPQAKKYEPCEPLTNGSYVEITGSMTVETKTIKKVTFTNYKVAVNFPSQVIRLTKPEKTTSRIHFNQNTTASVKKTGRPAAA